MRFITIDDITINPSLVTDLRWFDADEKVYVYVVGTRKDRHLILTGSKYHRLKRWFGDHAERIL